MTEGTSTPNRDAIELTGVRAVGHHGVFDHERRDGQEFVVDVRLVVSVERAARTDDLTDTIDYGRVAGQVVERIGGPAYDVIEALAVAIADDILTDERIASAEVTVHKPHAPIPHPFVDAAVRVRRGGGAHVVLALGANLGDRVRALSSAVAELAAVDGLDLTGISPLFETDPIGPEQPDYLNAVVVGRCRRTPEALLATLHEIEAHHDRVRSLRWGPRTLDLDLVQFGVPGGPREVLSDAATLLLPHPRAHERAFVLVPWAALEPNARLRLGGSRDDPVVGVAELLTRVGDQAVRLGPAWAPWTGVRGAAW